MPHRNKPSGKAPVFSASNILNVVGEELAAIKKAERLTYNDIAAVIGRSEDQAAKYCEGTAEMGIVAYANAARQWNGRFTGGLDRLITEHRPSNNEADRTRQSKVLKAALALSLALEDDGEITPAEVRKERPIIEQAIEALQAQLAKLNPRVAA